MREVYFYIMSGIILGLILLVFMSDVIDEKARIFKLRRKQKKSYNNNDI